MKKLSTHVFIKLVFQSSNWKAQILVYKPTGVCVIVCVHEIWHTALKEQISLEKIGDKWLNVRFERKVGLRGSRKLHNEDHYFIFFSPYSIHTNLQLTDWSSGGQECNIRTLSQKFKILLHNIQGKNRSLTINMRV
jgi:hypothetical protein